jgi:two-component system OmpR family response regulator
MRRELSRGGIDIVLLDLMLPDGDGIELCRDLRMHSKLPVIMLTAQGDPISRVLGLEMGADDYVAKPFEPRELLARIHALMRRSSGALASSSQAEGAPDASMAPRLDPAGAPTTRGFAGWQIDWRNRMLISPEGVGLSLSNVEYRLLAAFAEHPGEVLSRSQLVEMTRSAASENNERSIDLAVSRLRAKLRESLENPQFIRTVRGRGYQFTAELSR